MPGGRFSRPGDHSGPISDHFRRFRARPPICDLNIVILPQLRLLRHQHCASEKSTMCVETTQMSALATEDICLVSTVDICPVSAADICPVSTAGICPVSTEDISSVARTHICLVSTHNVEVSEVSSGPMPHCSSLRNLNCGNVSMFKSQIGGLALN